MLAVGFDRQRNVLLLTLIDTFDNSTLAVMDAACAKAGSHDAMMKKEGAKDAKECTLTCAKMGSKLVLYDSATKKVYQLDNQDKAKDFAGQHVTVKGDLKGKTIKVEEIAPAS